MTAGPLVLYLEASMKAPPKRKGNRTLQAGWCRLSRRLNESPSEKERKGNMVGQAARDKSDGASMKALLKRKENTAGYPSAMQPAERLNESAYEKVGKSDQWKISEIHGGKPQ